MELQTSETEGSVNFSVGILDARLSTIIFTLITAVKVAINALKTFQLVFPERFALVGIDEEIKQLMTQANTIFKAYVTRMD